MGRFPVDRSLVGCVQCDRCNVSGKETGLLPDTYTQQFIPINKFLRTGNAQEAENSNSFLF